MVSPQAKREAVTVLMTERDFGVTHACGLISISRSLYRYRSRRPDCGALRARIGEIAAVKRRYGYRRVHVVLRREGWTMNRKLTYRLYREAGLAVRRRRRKRIGPFERLPLPKPSAANLSWSMDFVADGLADGRRLRCLTIVDDCTRECRHRGRYLDHRRTCARRSTTPGGDVRSAGVNYRRSRPGVRGPSARCLGVLGQRPAIFYPPR
jgi:putative transposase